MEIFRDIWEWVVAVFENWHGYVSGGVLAFVIEISDRLWAWKPSKKIFIIILATGLAWSIFSVWREQKTENDDLRSQLNSLTVPNLEGELSQIASGYNMFGKFIVYTGVVVRNSSGASSGAKNWHMQVHCSDGRIFHNGIPIFNIDQKQVEFKMGQKGNIVLDLDQELMISHKLEKPLVAGAEEEGWYLAVFSEIKSLQDVSGCRAHLYFDDIVGPKKHDLEGTLGEGHLDF